MSNAELSPTESRVLGIITRYKCISPAECSYWAEDLTEAQIDECIPKLLFHRLIYLDQSGLPKRYCPRIDAVKGPTTDEDTE